MKQNHESRLRLVRVKKTGKLHSRTWRLLQKSFPPEERHTLREEKWAIKDNNYFVYAAFDKEFIGFARLWKNKDFQALLYMAIEEKMRGHGYGTKILEKLVEGKRKTVVEVEPPKTISRKRRVQFYRKLGFQSNSFDYAMPSQTKQGAWVPMKIMSRPKKLTRKEFTRIRDWLYQTIYHIELRGKSWVQR